MRIKIFIFFCRCFVIFSVSLHLSPQLVSVIFFIIYFNGCFICLFILVYCFIITFYDCICLRNFVCLIVIFYYSFQWPLQIISKFVHFGMLFYCLFRFKWSRSLFILACCFILDFGGRFRWFRSLVILVYCVIVYFDRYAIW